MWHHFLLTSLQYGRNTVSIITVSGGEDTLQTRELETGGTVYGADLYGSLYLIIWHYYSCTTCQRVGVSFGGRRKENGDSEQAIDSFSYVRGFGGEE
jgi:hypothetical protein